MLCYRGILISVYTNHYLTPFTDLLPCLLLGLPSGTASAPPPPLLCLTSALQGVGVVLHVVGVVLVGGFPPRLLCESPKTEDALVEWLRTAAAA